MARGKLRIYLGAAPGVGKTYAMLGEARRAMERGRDVVVGYVETHGRGRTAAMLDGLEVLPRRAMTYRGAGFTELDVDAVLRRAPRVALIDEIAHTNVPGSRNTKRWQDVDEVLDAGIDVITTLNVQHLESLNDVVRQITGVEQRETIPDDAVRRADQIELVDMSPQALRRRMAHGNVYPPEKVDAALSNYFREGNLTALRELALLWVADRVDEGLAAYRERHGIRATWEARERVVVALTGGPEGETLIRRAARIAAQGRGRALLAVHVTRSDGLTQASPDELARQRVLVESLGGSYHQVVGDDVPEAVLDFARAVNATQVIVGTSRRPSWQYVFGPGVGTTIVNRSGDVDVHMVTHEEAGRGRRVLPAAREALGPRRLLASWFVALTGPGVLTAALVPFRSEVGLTTELLLFLCLTIGVALIGGLGPAVFVALASGLLLNYFFTPPLHEWTIAELDNAIALVVFVMVGVVVATIVDRSARRNVQAARARAEAATLSTLAGSVLSGERALPALLERVKETFGLTDVSMLERAGDGTWSVVDCTGPAPCRSPGEADVTVGVTDTLMLAMRGPALPAEDQRILTAFASQAAAALQRRRLEREAARARALAEGNRIRTALLAAVSHDLRTPLASIKAGVSSLRATDVVLGETDKAELLAGVEESADRLDSLVGNLLDMSRLQTGSVVVRSKAVGLDEVVPAALAAVPAGAVKVEVPESLPRVRTDPGLLERAVANVVENAVRHSPAGTAVRLSAGALGDTVELQVVDQGPGIPDADKDKVFEPFQRLGDAPQGTGVGLGLAVAKGFTEAVGGDLRAENTPGGGLTMVFTLPSGNAPGPREPSLGEDDDSGGGAGRDTDEGA